MSCDHYQATRSRLLAARGEACLSESRATVQECRTEAAGRIEGLELALNILAVEFGRPDDCIPLDAAGPF